MSDTKRYDSVPEMLYDSFDREQLKESYISQWRERKQYKELCERQQAEIERLSNTVVDLQTIIAANQCEIDGLRAKLDAVATEEWDRLKAEIEQLRAELDTLGCEHAAVVELNLDLQRKLADVTTERDELRADAEWLEAKCNELHPRVWKLHESGREFVVVGEHEPYYLAVCELIRLHETKQGTWTEEDRVWFAAQVMKADSEAAAIDAAKEVDGETN